MGRDTEQGAHRWDQRLGELTISDRIVGYVYFRASRSGIEWRAEQWWRLSKVQDWWIETEEWFVRPSGDFAAFAGDNAGPEGSFEQLHDGKYTAVLSRLDPTAARDAGAPDEVDVDIRWVADEERDQLLAKLLAR